MSHVIDPETLPVDSSRREGFLQSFWLWAIIACVVMLTAATISAPENFKARSFGTASVYRRPLSKRSKD